MRCDPIGFALHDHYHFQQFILPFQSMIQKLKMHKSGIALWEKGWGLQLMNLWSHAFSNEVLFHVEHLKKHDF